MFRRNKQQVFEKRSEDPFLGESKIETQKTFMSRQEGLVKPQRKNSCLEKMPGKMANRTSNSLSSPTVRKKSVKISSIIRGSFFTVRGKVVKGEYVIGGGQNEDRVTACDWMRG